MFFARDRLLLGMSRCLRACRRRSQHAALLSEVGHCSPIHKPVANLGSLWSSGDDTPSFTVWVRSTLISLAQGGSSGRNYTEQKKSLVHYFLGDVHDISVQSVGCMARRGPCRCSFSRGAIRTLPGQNSAPWALLGWQVSL